MIYRYAIHALGNKVSFTALCIYINQRSRVDTELRDNLSLTRIILNEYMVSNGDNEIYPLEKPLDTAVHKRGRLRWVRKYLFILTSSHIYITFLDEKLFYTTSHREFLENLPKAAHKEEVCDRLVLPKIMSCCFPIKCMSLGVVGRPVPHRGFDGKILLERVTEEV